MIGHVSVEQYIFDDCKSVVDGMFCGLPLDEDSESEKNRQATSVLGQTNYAGGDYIKVRGRNG